MLTQYKEPKTIKEQIEILKSEKNVVFHEIDELKAAEYLYTRNYINVISPFKFNFAKKLDTDPFVAIKIRGKHIYDEKVDFSNYVKSYEDERNSYPRIFERISNFESIFNSVLSYNVLMYFKIVNKSDFDAFLNNLKSRLVSIKIARRHHYTQVLDSFSDKIEKYNSVFLFFDRLSLGEQLVIFSCSDNKMKKKILLDLYERECSFGLDDIKTFEEKLFTLINIRNCVYHNNSLEILVRYYDIKKKDIRNSSDRKSYTNLIKQLLE
jgi:hypothetical protein